MAGKPELPDDLEVVAGRRSSGDAAKALGEELVVGLLDGGPRRDDAAAEVQRYDEAGNSRAAEMSSSKSGTSASS